MPAESVETHLEASIRNIDAAVHYLERAKQMIIDGLPHQQVNGVLGSAKGEISKSMNRYRKS